MALKKIITKNKERKERRKPSEVTKKDLIKFKEFYCILNKK